MENKSDNVAEIEKYAFLLGSAIKNEDTDQFFSIYDAILPKDLPDNQLEEIKDRARKIVDLPDEEFNSLVLKARHFSLAPAGTAMTCRRESPSKQWTQPGKDESEDDHKTPFSYSQRFDTSSVNSTTKISTRSSESDTRRFDDDSGVCNSSKATNSIGSFSDGSEDEGHGVSFDYYPPQIKIRSGCGLSLDYDEAHEVKSDHSSQDVNSPRSDFSEGIEMTTFNSRDPDDDDDDDEFKFRRDMKYQDDFNTSGESEDESSYNKYYNLGYRPLSRDATEFQPSFKSYSTSSLRSNDVDRGISFSSLKDGTSQYSRYSSYQYPQTSSSDRVKIEKNSYKRGKTDPPFGRGPEHFGKVASSIDSLISKVPSDDVLNMPEGRKLVPMQKEDTKKKKRKKKKDDTATDENGNPIVETRGLNPAQYKQMRESPSVGGGTVANQPSDKDYGTFFPSDQHGTRSYSNSSRDIETDNINSKIEKRKKKKQEKLEHQKAEDIENYRGNQSIEELINFIGGQNDSNKKAKKNSTLLEDIPSKTQKSNKKNKDKKQKSPTASSSLEEVEVKGGKSAQSASLDKQVGENNMGNSSGKGDVEIVENGDIDGIYSKSDNLTKSSLKQNDKIDLNKSSILVDDDKSLKGVFCRESVKEKEHSATNNKRDIVTNSNTELNKPKTEKSGKGTKVDKLEMYATKSDEVLKADTIPNNVTVKQKNAKNKKNKASSPVLKVESEIPPADLDHQPILDNFPNGETFISDNFIFTDLDVPQVPKEDEFQVVGKKKKKVTKETGHQNNYLTNNVNSKPLRRYEERRPVLSHSSNKVSVPSVVQTTTVESDTRIRDLSPSAFPALSSGKGRQSYQEGRRNSTGDVPVPSGLKSQDDSDLESVKSLPATQGSQTVDSVLSPRLSYAKMAAGPKVPDSSGSSEKCSSLDSGDSEHDHKKSVWKGSPTERRHSIGSSPEEMNKVTGTQANVSTTSVKAGSQEHIVADVVISLEKAAPRGVPAAAWGGANSKAKSLEESTSNVLNKETASPGEAEVTLKECPVQTKSSISPSRNTGNDVSVNRVENPQQVVSGMQPCNNKPDMNSTYPVNKSSNVTNSSGHKLETSKSKTSTNGSNGKKQKSVIFLDKRVEETPGNLGISFGFEMDNLIKLSKTDPFDPDKIDQSEQIVEKNESHIASENVQFINDVSFLNNSNSEPKDGNLVTDIVKSTSSSSSVIFTSNHSNSIEKSNSSSSNNEKVDPVKTVPSQIVRMNGIVTPQAHNANLSKDTNDAVSESTDKSGETLETEQVIPETEDKGECVYYGENVVTLKKDVVVPSLNNGPTRYCGLLRFIEESELIGSFIVADAAAFLNKEWDRVKQMQEKDPESVKVHQE